MGFIIEVIADLTGIIVQEVYRFAHFRNGVAEGFTRFAHQNANQLLHLAFHQNGGAMQNSGALLWRCGEPDRRVIYRVLQCLFHFAVSRFTHVTDNVFRFGRVDDWRHFTVSNRMFEYWLSVPFLQRAVEQGGGK